MRARASTARALLAVAALASAGGAAEAPPATAPGASAEPAYDASHYAGGDGLTRKSAVVLKDLSDALGVAAEYAWVAEHYPGAKVTGQELTAPDHGRSFDVLTLRTAAGQRLELWFDISALSP